MPTFSAEYLAEDTSYCPRVGIYLTCCVAIFFMLLRVYARVVLTKSFGLDDLLMMLAVVIHNPYFFPDTHMWSLASSFLSLTCADIDMLYSSNNPVNPGDRLRCRKTHHRNPAGKYFHHVRTSFRHPICLYYHALAVPNLGSRVLCTYRKERSPFADNFGCFVGGG
jgi:hypothetical protein